MPYLPGDSLLFVAGAMAGSRYLNHEILLISLFFATVIGDHVNYWIGNTAGMKVLEKNWFLTYNVIGAALWILGFTLAGYFFGGIPIVQ